MVLRVFLRKITLPEENLKDRRENRELIIQCELAPHQSGNNLYYFFDWSGCKL